MRFWWFLLVVISGVIEAERNIIQDVLSELERSGIREGLLHRGRCTGIFIGREILEEGYYIDCWLDTYNRGGRHSLVFGSSWQNIRLIAVAF